MPSTVTDIIDGISTSTAVKAPVRAAASSHIALSGLQTISSVALAVGDRVLVTAQNDSVDNGIYVVRTGTWDRAKDFHSSRDVRDGTSVFVVATATWWYVTSDDVIVIGTSDINWIEILPAAGSVGTVLTVAALRLTIASFGGQTLNLIGYYAVGDVPSRLVRWDASSTAVDNGGSVFQVTGVVTGRWIHDHGGVINVKYFGAKGDSSIAGGGTDDYAAFVAAQAAAPDEGCEIVCPITLNTYYRL